jgi:hypothetical protein
MNNDLEFNGMPGQQVQPVQYDLATGQFCMADQDGRLVALDLGQGDVHFDAPLAAFAPGYALDQKLLIADKAMPPCLVEKASDYYWVHDVDDLYEMPQQTVVAPGGNVPEISPRQSTSQYVTLPRAMATFLPSEVEGNSDAALILAQRYMQLPMTKLLIMREYRVAQALQNASAYASANKITLAAGTRWNGGGTSDPVANLLQLIDESLVEITGIYMSRRTYNAFVQNPNVQKYWAFKDIGKPKPNVAQTADISAILSLPPIIVGGQKYKNPTTGTRDYIWGNDVVLLHHPEQMPAIGLPIAACTFRFSGGLQGGVNSQLSKALQQLTFSNGWGVRAFYDVNRGPQGGRKVIVFHQDAEMVIDTKVAGLIIGAWQTPP